MSSRYQPLAVYSLLLAAVAFLWLGRELAAVAEFPPVWVIALCISICLFVWQFGLRAPRVGLMSMERLPQIGLLLILPPPVAAAICAAASLLWPLLNRGYSHGSLQLGALRGLHNAAMTALMLLVAAEVYLALGGSHPLNALSLSDIVPLMGLALTAQAVNVGLMAAYFALDRRDVRRVITPIYALMDLVFVPAGVLAALLYNSGSTAIFVLFGAMMVVFVLSFQGVGHTLSTAETESGPLTRLSQARRALRGARHIEDLGNRILTETRSLFRFDEFYLALVDRERQILDFRVHERRAERLPVREKSLDAGLLGWVTEKAMPLLVEDWSKASDELRRHAEATDKQTGSLIAVPLIEDGDVIGVLSVQHTDTHVYSTADLHLMRGLAEQVAAALADALVFEGLENYRLRLEELVAERTLKLEEASQEKERLLSVLRERSRTLERESNEDSLTGIANRRCFEQRLSAEIEVALAVGQPLTLAIADLDRVKVINDRLGHAVGDEVLRRCAALMRDACRATDIVARIGGEEFALILPGITREVALELCDDLRCEIESHGWSSIHADLKVTLSIGLAQWDRKAEIEELLLAADTQLYSAKHAGRNRVA
jgi:diguanylate cyclase (GGDEF)-like protein